MNLKKIRIKNYKSIDNMEFDIIKHKDSYTTSFVGINEVGKSNILEAMSFLETPDKDFEFLEVSNQNNDTTEYIDLYFEMCFENKRTYTEIFKEKIISEDNFVEKINVTKIEKNVFLKRGDTKFKEQYNLELKEVNLKSFYLREIEDSVPDPKNKEKIKKYIIKKKEKLSDEEKEKFVELDLEKFKEILVELLESNIKKYENKVSFWRPDKSHLITSTIDLNAFKEDLNENIPLRNIFYLAEYKNQEQIKTKIEEVAKSESQLRRLEKQLSKKSTKYFNSKWAEHLVRIDFRITDQLMCKVAIQDEGMKNEDNFFPMQTRSDGFKQFASLIFTLSIENTHGKIKNRLILIDEPENHLHPSGIRDMREELIKIGNDNYVFLSTHSNFMIDNKTMERNIIIKKDSNNNTFKKNIGEFKDLSDDEVLKDAFGINVFRDFLTPHKLLVEGTSDKIILEKILKKVDKDFNFAITNGKGNNLPAIASLLNYQKIPSLVIIDDDFSGKRNKEEIIKVGNSFTKKNVFTIRDIEGDILENGTIEDVFEREYIIHKFEELHKKQFNKETKYSFDNNTPIIEQIKIYLRQNIKEGNVLQIEKFLETLKIKISEDFNPTNNLPEQMPLLYSLAEKIIAQLKK